MQRPCRCHKSRFHAHDVRLHGTSVVAVVASYARFLQRTFLPPKGEHLPRLNTIVGFPTLKNRKLMSKASACGTLDMAIGSLRSPLSPSVPHLSSITCSECSVSSRTPYGYGFTLRFARTFFLFLLFSLYVVLLLL